jgi:hypothetical protein
MIKVAAADSLSPMKPPVIERQYRRTSGTTTDRVHTLLFLSDGTLLRGFCCTPILTLWDACTGELIKTISNFTAGEVDFATVVELVSSHSAADRNDTAGSSAQDDEAATIYGPSS